MIVEVEEKRLGVGAGRGEFEEDLEKEGSRRVRGKKSNGERSEQEYDQRDETVIALNTANRTLNTRLQTKMLYLYL